MTPHDRLRGLAERLDLDGLMLREPPSLRYALGIRHVPHFDSPWGAAEAFCLVPRVGEPLGILPNPPWRGPLSLPVLDVRFYRSYAIDQSSTPADSMWDVLITGLSDAGMSSGRLGVEMRGFQVGMQELSSRLPRIRSSDISQDVPILRSVKTDEELGLLRRAVAVSVAGQRAARRIVRAGMSEIEAFSAIRLAMELEAGAFLPGLVVDFLSGSRCSYGGGLPSLKQISLNDMILSDLVVCVNGYWGDTTSSFVLGQPDPEQRKIHQLVDEALRRGIDIVRPGVPAKQIDSSVRSFLNERGYSYRHHTGHGIGITYYEQPFITPGNEMILQPGMVLVVEPGIYLEGQTGARLEDAAVVTEDGYELLSFHDKDLT